MLSNLREHVKDMDPTKLLIASGIVLVIASIIVAFTTTVGLGGQVLRNTVFPWINGPSAHGTVSVRYFFDEQGQPLDNRRISMSSDGLIEQFDLSFQSADETTIIEAHISWFKYPGGLWGPTCKYFERIFVIRRHYLDISDGIQYTANPEIVSSDSAESAPLFKSIVKYISSDGSIPATVRDRLASGRSINCRVSLFGYFINAISLASICGIFAGIGLLFRRITQG